jgi:hypothetical protein
MLAEMDMRRSLNDTISEFEGTMWVEYPIDCRTRTQRKIGDFYGGDYDDCRLLGYENLFVSHRKHATSRLQGTAG